MDALQPAAGLDLTAANQAHLRQVVLLEPYRDAAAEEWAISHVQRLGFSGVVAVTQLVAADTIEDQIMLVRSQCAAST